MPALSAWSEEWKANGAIVPPRGFAFAAYEVAPRQLLLVYGLHLKSNRGELNENIALRQESMSQLLSHMDAMETAYGKLGTLTWIVGGDCNTSLDDPQYANETTLKNLMAKGFAWVWQGMPLGSESPCRRTKVSPQPVSITFFIRARSCESRRRSRHRRSRAIIAPSLRLSICPPRNRTQLSPRRSVAVSRTPRQSEAANFR